MRTHDIDIVGLGAGGIAAAASLLRLDVAIGEPSESHYPGLLKELGL